MLVRSKVPAFINGKLLNVGKDGFTEEYEYTPKKGRELPRHLVPSENAVKAAVMKSEGKSKKQIMYELDAAGIHDFDPTAERDDLLALLDAEIAKTAPGGIKPLDKSPLEEADKLDGPTRRELMASLKEKGISFHATMRKDELAELLTKAG